MICLRSLIPNCIPPLNPKNPGLGIDEVISKTYFKIGKTSIKFPVYCHCVLYLIPSCFTGT